MKINIKQLMLWLLGISVVCLGISFFLFRQAGIGPSDLGHLGSSSEKVCSRKINDSMRLGNENYRTIKIETTSAKVEVIPTHGEFKAEFTGNFNASGEEFMPYLDVSSNEDALSVEIKHPKGLFAGAVSSANLGSVSGDINASRLSLSEGIFESSSGKIKIDSLSGQVLSKTTSGDIDLVFEKFENTAYMESISGSVNISIPENASLTLKTETVSGNLSCDAPLTIKGGKDENLLADIGGGGPIMEIRSVSGDIKLR